MTCTCTGKYTLYTHRKKIICSDEYYSNNFIFLLLHHYSLLEVDVGIVVRVDGLAEVDGIAKLLVQDRLTGVTRDLEQEEAGVGLWKVVVGRMVLVEHLHESRNNE